MTSANGFKYNKTKTFNGKNYMTCWLIRRPNKDGKGYHWYGKVTDSKGKCISLRTNGETIVRQNKRGEEIELLGVDVSTFSANRNGGGSGMTF